MTKIKKYVKDIEDELDGAKCYIEKALCDLSQASIIFSGISG